MEKNVNSAIVSQNRKPISMIGANLGTMYFQAEARASWPNFVEDQHHVHANNDIEFILNRTPRRYRMTGHDITSVAIGIDGTGATKVFLNKDAEDEVSIPVGAGMEKIGVVSEDAIGKALRGDNSMIFSNAQKLAQQLNVYNQDEKKRLLDLRAKIDKFINQLDSAIDENTRKAENYIREITSSTPTGIPSSTNGSDGVVVVTE